MTNLNEVEDIEEALSNGDIKIVTGESPVNEPEKDDEQEQHDQPKKEAEASEEDDGEESQQDERLGEGREELSPEERTERNRLKRKMRKEHERRLREQNAEVINTLKQQNDMLAKRLAALEGSANAQRMQDVENAIVGIETRLKMVNDGIKKSISEGDGETAAKLLAEMNDLNTRRSTLEFTKTAIRDSIARRQQEPEQEQPDTDTVADVETKARQIVISNMGTRFIKTKAPWYDGSLKDEDSVTLREIDIELASEGYDPTTPEYYEELEKRASVELPHRFKPQNAQPKKVVTGGSSRGSSNSASGVGVPDNGVPKAVINIWKANGVWPEDKEGQKQMIAEYKRNMGQR